MDSEVLTCPYCGQEQLCHEPDEISAHLCYTECENCGKSFWYSVTVIRMYSTRKDDTEIIADT